MGLARLAETVRRPGFWPFVVAAFSGLRTGPVQGLAAQLVRPEI